MTGLANAKAAQLSAFVQGQGGAVSAAELRRHSLSAFAYRHLPAGHPLRAEVRADYRQLAVRRQIVLTELAPLFAAWQKAGVQVLVFKGFHLAEFVYDTPDTRYYGDIDVLIRPQQAALALQAAKDAGFREVWQAEDSLTPGKHELMQLVSASQQVTLDVHARILHNVLPTYRRQQRITDAVWDAATPLARFGLLGPSPIDALLVCLILNRLWVPEGWTIRAQDLLDFRALVSRFNLTREALEARARSLNCTRTLRQFLRRCDGFANTTDLRPPTAAQRLRWDAELLPERGSVSSDYLLAAALTLPGAVGDMLREAPNVARVLWHLRSRVPIEKLLGVLTPPEPQRPLPLARRKRLKIVRGVHLGLALLRVRPAANCLPRSLAIYASLRRAGQPATLLSGVRRGASGIESHAWVELGGFPVEDSYIHENPGSYRVNFSYPPQSL